MYLFVKVVGERGLEPPRLAALVPKTSVYTISPLAHLNFYEYHPLHPRYSMSILACFTVKDQLGVTVVFTIDFRQAI